MAKLARRWIFTLNNYTDWEYETVKNWPVKYMVVGKEVGEEGTPHLQGYCVFEGMKRLSAMKKLGPRAHFEVARGTTTQNWEYCTKEGCFEEVGERPSDDGSAGGKKEMQRWEEARDAARKGNIDDVPADIYLRYYRTLKEIAKDHMAKPDDCADVTGVWLVGPPGVGKSHKARAEHPGAYFKNQNKWWDGYQGEESVIIDDYDSKELGHHLKIWADKYSFIAETKGGAMHIRPKAIVITSNYTIEDIWGGDDVLVAALKRRFRVVHVTPFME